MRTGGRGREKAHQVKVCATRRDDLPCDTSHGGRTEPAPTELPSDLSVNTMACDIHGEINNRIMIYWFVASTIHPQHSWDIGVLWSILVCKKLPKSQAFSHHLPNFPQIPMPPDNDFPNTFL